MNAANRKKRQSQRRQTNHHHDRTEAKGQHSCQIAVDFGCIGHTSEIARGARAGKMLRCPGTAPSSHHLMRGHEAALASRVKAGAIGRTGKMPSAPVGWMDVDPLAGQGAFPVTPMLRAGKYKRMFAFRIEDG